jgi:hypothetical protein
MINIGDLIMQIHGGAQRDQGMNLAILNGDGLAESPAEWEVLRKNFRPLKLEQSHAIYDQLVYPLIFWEGTGGCGHLNGELTEKTTTQIRKVLISLMLQPRTHFLHSMETLREEFLCATYGRLVNIQVKWLLAAQHLRARQDEISTPETNEDQEREYGLRTFIPASMTDSDQYWHAVKEKCFALTSKLGPPTIFLTITMNPYWPDYDGLKRGTGSFSDGTGSSIMFRARMKWLMHFCKKKRIFGTVRGFVWRIEYQQRGLPHAHILFWTDCDTTDAQQIDRIITARYPLPSTIQTEQAKINDLITLIDAYQVHEHTDRCQMHTHGKCKYGFPQPEMQKTTTRKGRCQLARGNDELNIVPFNPELLALLRCHICAEAIHTDSCLAYVLKYCMKNSDRHVVDTVLYEGRKVDKKQKLEFFAASKVSSAGECFACISGARGHHTETTVAIINGHLPGKRIMFRPT